MTGEHTARGWLAHLRDQGTTPWPTYAAQHADPPGDGGGADAVRLPGAQELELLRRLNVRHRELGRTTPPDLVHAVLEATPGGRGAQDLRLVGLPTRPYGARPVDPSRLPASELLRVASAVIAERLLAVPDGPAPSAPARVVEGLRRRASGRRHGHPFRLAGPSARVVPVRDRLAALGRTPGGRTPTAYVLGAEPGRLLADAWTTRILEGAAPPWPDWLRTWVRRDACPPRADLVAVADAWAAELGRDRVEVVLEAGTLAGLLGTDRPVEEPPAPAAAAVELARRVSAVLGVLVDRPHRTRLLTHVLLPRLAVVAGPPLVVPEEHRDWLERRGRALRRGLTEGGYRVHGSVAVLDDPPTEPGVGVPEEGAVLDAAVETLSRWSEGDQP